jgi:hypothetical protein
MGVDFLPGMAITYTGQALAQNDPTTALDSYEAFSAAWTNQAVRRTPGATSVLRLSYPGSGGVRRAYGRGRSVTPTLGLVKQGWLGFVAEFDACDNSFYDDVLQTLRLGTALATTGGVAPPLTPPVVLAAQQSATNQLPAADADFELPWTQNWQPDALISTMDRTTAKFNTGSYSMITTITAAGTAQFHYSQFLPIIAGKVYGLKCNVIADSNTTGGTATLKATFYNVLGVQVGSPTTIVSGSVTSGGFAFLSGQYTAPPSATQVEFVVTYASPAAGNVYWDTWIATDGTYVNFGAFNSGSVDTWPVITFKGPCTNPSINYRHTAKKITLKTTIKANQIAVIQTVPWNRCVGITTALSVDPFDDLPLSSSLAGYMRGDTLDDMALPPGLTLIDYTAQDVTGNSRCDFAWRNAWTSIGGSLI